MKAIITAILVVAFLAFTLYVARSIASLQIKRNQAVMEEIERGTP